MGEDRFIGGVAEARGIPLDPAPDKARTYAIYLDLIRGRLTALPGVRDYVTTCRARGLLLAVASSADEIKVNGNLEEIGLPSSTFDVVVNGSEVARKKPAPDLFLEACRRLALEPAACLVIEDALSGIAAARAAGCRCLAVTTSFPADWLAAAGADWVVSGLDHAPPAVLDW
jgi:HAD superfamily hydrolase (TIGR01509 family)